MSIDCVSEVEADEGKKMLQVADIKDWLDGLPQGAVLHAITRDFGNQRDATWSENR